MYGVHVKCKGDTVLSIHLWLNLQWYDIFVSFIKNVDTEPLLTFFVCETSLKYHIM